MKIHQIKSSLFNSNTYIIENNSGKILLVDPGDPKTDKIIRLINTNNWIISGVLLTHEHADHIAGLINLINYEKFPIYCSAKCSINIRNSKLNFSRYIEEIDPFVLEIDTKILINNKFYKIEDFEFRFVETPGHSPGGACYIGSDLIFSGDTILENNKTVLKFPNSSIKDYENSINKLKKYLQKDLLIYPGHGNPFLFT